MIGREKRVLLRHYLEQGMSKAAIARHLRISRRTVYNWIEAGELDRGADDKAVRYRPRAPQPSTRILRDGDRSAPPGALDYGGFQRKTTRNGGRPDGATSSYIKRFGREGEGPGDFDAPGRFYLRDDALVVRDWRGFTTFSLDGEFIVRDAIPPWVSWRGFSFSYESLLADGSFLATPVVGGIVSEGLTGDDPMHEFPWLRVAQQAGSWVLDSVALESHRNTTIVFPGTGNTFATFFDQPWIRPDACQGDATTGSVVCARTQAMAPGVAGLVEVSVGGDTLWTRKIQLQPLPVEDHEYAEKMDWMASIVSRSHSGDSVASPLMKQKVRGKLANPGFWPAIRGIRLMPNGEVWFRRLKDGASHVWYAARRGETESPIRRIVLPEDFKPRYVNDTHIWGDRSDELGVTYVAGRRLVRARE